MVAKSPFPKDVLKELALRIERLTKWANEFDKCRDRCAPGFQLPHEIRLSQHFWIEIDDQISEIAHELRDGRGLVKMFVHYCGYLNFKSGTQVIQINTAKRLVDFLATSSNNP